MVLKQKMKKLLRTQKRREQKRSPGGVVVSMSASHAKGPGFDPHRLHELSSKKSTNIEGDDMMTFAIIVVSGIVEIQFLILQ